MVRCCPPLRGEAWNQAFRVSVAKNLRFVRFVRLGTGVSRAQSVAHSRYRERGERRELLVPNLSSQTVGRITLHRAYCDSRRYRR